MNILKKLGLGTESFENPMDGVAAGYIATGDESETASAAILEATKESAEIDEEIGTLTDVQDATDAIDDQVEIGEIAIEQNQYTPMLGIIQKTALKNALASISSRDKANALVNDTSYMPANESFENGNGGTLAVESMKDTAAELWATIKAQFKAIMDKIMTWFKNIFEAGNRLATRADKLKANAKNAVAGKVNPTAAGSIMVGNKLGSDAISGFDIVVNAVEEALSESKLATVGFAIDAGDANKSIINFTGGTVPSDLQSTAPEGATVTCSKEASGGVLFVTIIGKDGENHEAIKNSHNVIHNTSKKEKPSESDALTSGEITSTMTKVAKLGRDIARGKQIAAKFDAANKQFEKEVNKAAGKDNKDEQKAERAKFGASVTFGQKAAKFRKDIVIHALKAGNAMCNYAEASCKGGKTEEKKEEKKEAGK